MAKVNIKNRVKIARLEDTNLTQGDLATLVGVTRQTMNLIEAQKYNPSIYICLNISNHLNKSIDELFWLGKED